MDLPVTEPDMLDSLLSGEERDFRHEVRRFILDTLDPAVQRVVDCGKHLPKAMAKDWEKALHQQGWSAPSWPTEYGGPGWSAVQRYLFDLEIGLNGAPKILPFGINMVGPVIYTFGTPEQKAKYLPGILSGKDSWCQGFSEPGAGSDLAALKTRAEDKGDHYLLNGQKIWTSKAHEANLIFLLARTSSEDRPQQGISFLLADMNSDGITVKPIISIDLGHSLNEVFFEDVVVPKANLVGEEGRGWTYTKFLLNHERTGISGIARSKRQVRRLRQILQQMDVPRDPTLLPELARLEVDLMAVELTELRALCTEQSGTFGQLAPSVLKQRGTEIQQQITAILRRAAGPLGAIYDEEFLGTTSDRMLDEDKDSVFEGVLGDYLFRRAATIYGGTSQVQKNIIFKVLSRANEVN